MPSCLGALSTDNRHGGASLNNTVPEADDPFVALPTSRSARLLAAAYVLAVVGSALAWVVHGADSSAMWLTWIVTLPWSIPGAALASLAAIALPGTGLGEAVVTGLILVLFPGAAVANVLLARAAWGAWRRRLHRRTESAA
jgi:hypothetical protein